jgi:outer membrane immunogenic protein
MKHTIRLAIITAITLFCAILLAAAPNARAAGNIFEHFASPTDSYDWSGFYAGFNTGATWNHFDFGKHTSDVNLVDQFYVLEPLVLGVQFDTTASFDFPGNNDKTSNKPIGGLQGGFNFQFGHFVVGGEGSFSGNTSDGQSKFEGFQEHTIFIGQMTGLSQPVSGEFFTETNFSSIRKVETGWNGFIGGRLGFAWGRFLFYGSGGAAFTDVKFTAMDKADTSFFANECDGGLQPCPGTPRAVQPAPPLGAVFIGEVVSRKTSSHKDILTGWYGGGGALYALTNNVSLGVDYKRVDWGDKTDHFSSGGPVFPGNTNIGVSADQLTFQVNVMLWPFH